MTAFEKSKENIKQENERNKKTADFENDNVNLDNKCSDSNRNETNIKNDVAQNLSKVSGGSIFSSRKELLGTTDIGKPKSLSSEYERGKEMGKDTKEKIKTGLEFIKKKLFE